MAESQNSLVWQQAKQEKKIYEYLRHSVQIKPPQEMIREFRYLFLELVHTNKEVRHSLENIVLAKHKEDIFFQILTYCCHILINYWSQVKDNHTYILELIEIFNLKNIPPKKSNSRPRQKLFILLKKFSKTEEYKNLKRIAKFINNSTQVEFKQQSLIGDLLPHYYYLYSAVLLGKQYTPETTNLIINLQQKRQEVFESELAKHIIYRSRLVQIARAEQLSNRAGKIIKRVKNPTFLGEKEFKNTLKQYLNNTNGTGTIYQNTRQFLIKVGFLNSYRDFKESLYEYLISDIQQSNNNRYSLERTLKQSINGISKEYDYHPCTDKLILKTCQRLLRFLIIDTTRQGRHYQLIELIMNLGTSQTAALLMKIVLISPDAKSDLEQRLGILFSVYESRTIEEAKWLVKLLENILIASSFYFGNVDLSIAKVK